MTTSSRVFTEKRVVSVYMLLRTILRISLSVSVSLFFLFLSEPLFSLAIYCRTTPIYLQRGNIQRNTTYLCFVRGVDGFLWCSVFTRA